MSGKVLVIKLGALGDWILATGAFKAIKEHHPKQQIYLLTTKPFEKLAYLAPWFNEVIIDERSNILNIKSWRLLKKLKRERFEYIYDLQNNDRTRVYYYILKKNIHSWCGRLPKNKASLMDNPNQHVVECTSTLLKTFNINVFPHPDLSFLEKNSLVENFSYPQQYLLIIPGCSPKNQLKKSWHAQGYAEVIEYYYKLGLTSIIIGQGADINIISKIESYLNQAKIINLIDKSPISMIIKLSKQAFFTLGIDTGPMHIAGIYSRCLVLFSKYTDPTKSKPWGNDVNILHKPSLQLLTAKEVINRMEKIINV